MSSDSSNGASRPSEHEEHTISGMANLLGIDRNVIYRWLNDYEQVAAFKNTAIERDGGKYYPKDQWSAFLASVGQAYPDPNSDRASETPIIDGELLDSGGGTLAKLSDLNQSLDELIRQKTEKVDELIRELQTVEGNITEAEIISWQKQGLNRALTRFQVETQAEQLMMNKLRQQKMEGSSDD